MHFLNKRSAWLRFSEVMAGRYTLLLYLSLSLALASCRKEDSPIIKPSEFNKSLREDLGREIKLAIAANPEQFPLLPDMPPYQSTAYEYVRELYAQATNEMQLDRRSPDMNRWDQSRAWQVRIIQSNVRNAFVIPGGDFYITTGFLKLIQQEYQLYYVMVFEAALMQESYLLNQLFEEYGAGAIHRIALGEQSAKPLSLALANWQLEPELVQELDNKTAELICASSTFDRRGILPLIQTQNKPDRWLELRQDYIGRDSYVSSLSGNEGQCGQFRTNGSYKERVLDWLK